MKTIYKQKLEITDVQIIELPKYASILHLDVQGDRDVCFWYTCDPSLSKEKIKVYCFGTGQEIPEDIFMIYIGTALVFNGEGVFHFYYDLKCEQ